MDDVHLPSLLVASSKSQFRLRCVAAAWSSECGGAVRRYTSERDGLLLLSAVGPDTATKAVRALLYASDLDCEFTLELNGTAERLVRAQYDGKTVSYDAKVARLAPGAIHIVALARVPGLLPCLDDQHLFAELNSPRYSTPLLRPWVGWLKRRMIEDGRIVMAESHNASAGILAVKPEELDELVSEGVRSGYLRMVA